jgi:predicted transcriptional regulator of viral defense system
MKWRDFSRHFQDWQLIELQDIRNVFGNGGSVQLSRWVEKGLLIRLRRGQYILASKKDSINREVLANEIKTSYISLEYALNYYNFIPEVPRRITSVTIQRGEMVSTPVGDYLYRHIQPRLFSGYRLVGGRLADRPVKIAEPTKALFDFVYFNRVGDRGDFEKMRLNQEEVRALFQADEFESWIRKVANPALRNRLEGFLSFM